MVSILTNFVLDISFGVLWWTTKKTGSALYSGLGYFLWKEESKPCGLKNESEYILMTDFKQMLNTKNEEINKLNERIKYLEG